MKPEKKRPFLSVLIAALLAGGSIALCGIALVSAHSFWSDEGAELGAIRAVYDIGFPALIMVAFAIFMLLAAVWVWRMGKEAP